MYGNPICGPIARETSRGLGDAYPERALASNLIARLVAATVGGGGGFRYVTPALCFQSSAGTGACAVGDPVGYITDSSGNGRHWIQATNGNRGTLAQDSNGFYYIAFDGTTTFYTCSTGGGASAFTSVFAWQLPAFDGAVRNIVSNRGTTNLNKGWNQNGNAGADAVATQIGNGTTLTTPATQITITAGANFVAASRYDGTNIYNSVDGGAETSAAATLSASDSNQMTLGRRNGNSSLYADGRYYGDFQLTAAASAAVMAGYARLLAIVTQGRNI